MQIQRLTPGHAAQYRMLMLEAYAKHPDAFTTSVSDREALPLSWWETRLAADALPDALVLGAFDGDELIGVAGLSFETREKTRHKARLFGMFVPAAYRGRGIGRRLVDAVLDTARARAGVMLVQLSVTQGNRAAEALYLQSGFVAFGLEPYAVKVGDGFVSKIHMGCRLA